MYLRLIPVFPEDPRLPVQIQPVHPKGNRDILRPPLFLAGILVLHPQIPHHFAAAEIVYIVRSRDIGDAVPSRRGDRRSPCLGHSPPAPDLPPEPVAEVTAPPGPR